MPHTLKLMQQRKKMQTQKKQMQTQRTQMQTQMQRQEIQRKEKGVQAQKCQLEMNDSNTHVIRKTKEGLEIRGKVSQPGKCQKRPTPQMRKILRILKRRNSC